MRWLEPQITTPATTQPVTLDEAKAHLRVDSADEDALIAALIAACVAQAEVMTGIYLATQTVEVKAWGLEDCTFRLPVAPVQSITSITYVDLAGATQTLDPTTYVSSLTGLSPRLARAYNKLWPVHRCGLGSITLTAVCGYAAGLCPAPIKQAILLSIGDLYSNREAVVIDASRVTMIENPTAERLLANYRRAYV